MRRVVTTMGGMDDKNKDLTVMRTYRLPASLVEAIERYGRAHNCTATSVIRVGVAKVLGKPSLAGRPRKRRRPPRPAH